MKTETSVMIRALTITLELTQKFQFHYVRLGHGACLGCENCNISVNSGKYRVGFQPCD